MDDERIEQIEITDLIITGADEIAGGRGNVPKGAVEKDATIAALFPEEVSECSLISASNSNNKSTCTSSHIVATIGTNLKVTGTDAEIMNAAKSRHGCDTEACVLKEMRIVIGHDIVDKEIRAITKLDGPTDIKLLTNNNIDQTLKQWELKFKNFFAYNFNMRDYMAHSFRKGEVLDTPDTLATVTFNDIVAHCGASAESSGKVCAACVINSDVYAGAGKHWMALFLDARDPSRATVEFFNSSGNAPAHEWVRWMEKMKSQIASWCAGHNITCASGFPAAIKVCNIQHQESQTECGLYSLFYIWARLNNVPYKYFADFRVPDQHMFEFRQHLFANGKYKSPAKFDFDEFDKVVKVKWED